MKNRVLRERYAALLMLSRRVLPSPTAVNKVCALLETRFRRAYEATEASRKKIIADVPTPPGWEGEALPPLVAEARQEKLDALMELDTPVGKVPDRLRLRADDLPKPLKREGGETNVEGLAEIKLMLGGLYVLGDDELALRESDSAEGEQEPE